MDSVIHLGPQQYVHVLNLTTITQRVEVGPKSLAIGTNEQVVGAIAKFLVVPPRHYCKILNPVVHGLDGKFSLRLGHHEYRFHEEPFPLYPGEAMEGGIKQLPVVPPEHAVHLRCDADFDDDGTKRVAGEEWSLAGPCVYYPHPSVSMVAIIKPVIIKPGCAVHLRAKREFTDDGVKRATSEEWLYREAGAYVPHVYAEVINVVEPRILTDSASIHLRARLKHVDAIGVARRAGEEWLITSADAGEWIVDVTQELIAEVKRVILSSLQWCVVVNPATTKDGHSVLALGLRQRRVGPATFFLHPGEFLEKGVCQTFVLQEHESMLLCAREAHEDSIEKGKKRLPGDRWLITGPCQYVPPTTVEIVASRSAIVLKENEGIYVRNMQKGSVRVIMGPLSYMLGAEEELWAKELSAITVAVLAGGGGLGEGDIRKLAYYEASIDSRPREPYHVVTYRCPSGCALQIFNFREKLSRVVLGPNLAILGPWEHFNILSLSAGKPKVSNALKSIPMMLGPDFITDRIQVETADHARLSLLYGINYRFKYDPEEDASLQKLFAVPDFIGFVARQLASRIRITVAQTAFDEFHRHSAAILKTAVFGGEENNTVTFEENNLVISDLDVQEIAPVDASMQELLVRSVQMAISISTKSIEETARQEAALQEQASRGRLELQSLASAQEAEKARITLCELRALSAAVESAGVAVAEAKARAESQLITSASEVEMARLRAEAAATAFAGEAATLDAARREEIRYTAVTNKADVKIAKERTSIEVASFQAKIACIGSATVRALAAGGHEGSAGMGLLGGLHSQIASIASIAGPTRMLSAIMPGNSSM